MKKSITILIIGLLAYSVFPADPMDADTLREWVPKPSLAAGLSFAIPGAGQIYNRRYWKAPIAMGLEGYAILAIADSWIDMRDAEELGRMFAEETSEYQSARFNWEDARERRNIHMWLLAGFVLISSLDAYIDAHLYPWKAEMGRDIVPEASKVALSPVFDNEGGIGLMLSLSLNLP